jgi:hypothetical protein
MTLTKNGFVNIPKHHDSLPLNFLQRQATQECSLNSSCVQESSYRLHSRHLLPIHKNVFCPFISTILLMHSCHSMEAGYLRIGKRSHDFLTCARHSMILSHAFLAMRFCTSFKTRLLKGHPTPSILRTTSASLGCVPVHLQGEDRLHCLR